MALARWPLAGEALMAAPIPLADAWAQLLGLIEPLGSELRAVEECQGCILATELVACRTQPSHDLSAMDGFALSAGNGPWRLVGESRAGTAFGGVLEAGKAVKISTGAHVPQGASSILIVENARVDGSQLIANEPVIEGKHIRRAGFDFAQGDTVLPAGTRIDAAQIALSRSAGHAQLQVHKTPKVAILECGDELVADPANCPDDRLPASNGAMLAAMARKVGAEVQSIGPVGDSMEALEQAFAQARDADLIITSGGASVGEHDLVKPALEKLGAKLGFWKVAIRPGKPLLVAQLSGVNSAEQLVLGLPGNPVSSFVTAFLFALPALRAMQGASTPLPQAVPLPAATDIGPGKARQEFLRARLVNGQAQPLNETDSSALMSLAKANLLIDRPIDADEVKRGTSVPCYLL
jgi:molybdopterin molybdotransferase